MNADPKQVVFSPSEAANAALEAIRQRAARKLTINTFLPTLNTHVKPLNSDDLVIVLGRSSHYKTGFLNFWSRQACKQITDSSDGDYWSKAVVIYISLEMSVSSLAINELAGLARVPINRILDGRVDVNELQALSEAAFKRAAMPIWYIGHSPERLAGRQRLTMNNITAAVDHVVGLGFKVHAVFIDFLQMIESDNPRAERRIAVGDSAYRCKDMATMLGCPVIVACQSNREVDNRPWQIPTMGDGHESSGIEHAADLILGLWMPHRTNKIGEQLASGVYVEQDMLLIGVSKQRHGPTGNWEPFHVDHDTGDIICLDRLPY